MLTRDASAVACVQSLSSEEVEQLKIFKRKLKEGQVDRVHDEQTVICKNLFQPGTDMNLFLGMSVQLGEDGPRGTIDSTFGKARRAMRRPLASHPMARNA